MRKSAVKSPASIFAVCLIIAALLLVMAPDAWSDDELELRMLEEQEVLDLLSGATLYGKYTDGRPDWAEQTAATGQLFDAADEWREVGSWTTIADMACYKYIENGDMSCFDVYEKDGVYYFFSPGTDRLIAFTTRIDRPPMM